MSLFTSFLWIFIFSNIKKLFFYKFCDNKNISSPIGGTFWPVTGELFLYKKNQKCIVLQLVVPILMYRLDYIDYLGPFGFFGYIWFTTKIVLSVRITITREVIVHGLHRGEWSPY